MHVHTHTHTHTRAQFVVYSSREMIGAILKVGAFFAVGLLFMDLVPLQENMRCEDYSNTTTCPEAFWAQDYFSARGKFRMLAGRAGAEITTFLVAGDDYTMDFAIFKGSPEKVLIHASGTHGVEGFVGSAIQAKVLSEWNATSPGTRPTIVFVHAVNPYGFAKLRRFNEENVDLNRNHLTREEWSIALKRDPNIANFASLWESVGPRRAPNLLDRYLFLFQAGYWVARNGFEACKRAIVTGQYFDETAPYFGGKEQQRSIDVLAEGLRPVMELAKKAIFIDVHSGLGPLGVDTFMVDDKEQQEVAESIFPHRVEAHGGAGASSGYELMMGGLSIQKMFPSVNVVEVTEEFGTIPGIFVARNIILENAAYHYARDSHLHEITQQWLRDAFYPQTMVFKRKVLAYGLDAFYRAHLYLSSL